MDIEQMFRSALDVLDEAVCLCEQTSQVIYANPSAERPTGCSGSEAGGKSCRQVLGSLPPLYLENLFGHANAPIIVWDPDSRITRINHAFERLTGHLAGDVLGKTLDISGTRRSSTMKMAEKSMLPSPRVRTSPKGKLLKSR